MASEVHDSDSDGGMADLSSRRSNRDSPARQGQSDQPGPADSEEDSGVYEIEAILDAKRGATGSTRIGYLVKWKGYDDDENSWVDEQDAAGAKELIKEFWARHGKKKGERVGRKSDAKPKAPPRRAVAASVESTPDPTSASTKKRGRGRQNPKVDSDDDGAEEEEEVRSRKKGRKSNGTTRKMSTSPASSSDRASEGIQTFEPSSIKKWNALPSWEKHLEEIDTVERTPDGDLLIYFKLKGEKIPCKENSKICAEKFPQALISFYEAHLKWKQTEAEQESD